MDKLRVSAVQYLNTVPLIWGLAHGPARDRFELDFTTPARCADAVREGRAGVGIIPTIELQRIDNLEVIPGVSISSWDRVRSVALFSKKPIEEVESVALDTSSRTSAALVTILLKKFYGLAPRLTPRAPDGDAMLAVADAALLIGDPALAYGRAGLKVYDLAEEWRKFTGLPFVFAVWAGPQSAGLGDFSQAFRDSRDYGLAHIEQIAAEYAPRHRMSAEEVKVYLTRHINYNLTEEHCRGLALFHRLACEMGLIAAVRELRFV